MDFTAEAAARLEAVRHSAVEAVTQAVAVHSEAEAAREVFKECKN